MKVLILANNDIGLYIFRKDLIKRLINEKNEVYISLPDGEKIRSLIELGCRFIDTDVDRRGINPIKDIRLVQSYLKIVKKVKPDMVITYTIKPNIYGGIMCRIKNIPYFCNVTGLGTAFQSDNWLKKLSIILYKVAFKKVKTVFFENSGNRDIFLENKIISKEKTHVLNGAGVNLDDFPFSEYPSEQETRFLFIGRVMKEKGIEEFCEAAKKIKTDYSDVVFDVVGPMEDDYREYIEKYDDVINYHGVQMDVRPFIKQAHCFVLPSYHEGMANTLLENGAMGRPLITSNIHGCLEAVDDNKTGYLCAVKSTEDLYKKMKLFIELPYDIKKQMGQASYEYISEKFDKRLVVEETIVTIDGIVK